VLLSMSRRVSPLAGFQVTIIGRFWVTTEGMLPIGSLWIGASLPSLQLSWLSMALEDLLARRT